MLAHAVIDALLGAAGLGDIGEHFPDTDPAYEGADSISLLRDVVALLGRREILHVDTTVLLERPKIGPLPGVDPRLARRRAARRPRPREPQGHHR